MPIRLAGPPAASGTIMSEDPSSVNEPPDDRRRRFVGYLVLAALGASGAAGAWYATRPDEPATPTVTATPTDETTPTEAVPALVRRYAPDLYFGRLEKWYPTDPRPYVVETAAGSVVDGFTALEDYSAAFAATGTPPAPTVFFRVVEAAEGVDAIQYWMYSVFDQFTVNFHWHDWELLQVFVERDSDRPLLLSASAHARAIPNNEFLDPSFPDGRRPGVLAEVGSHSSASEVNAVVPSFERVATDRLDSDVTNDYLDVTAELRGPFAYGLPRDEGARLPFVMPELDGTRLDQHPDLSVTIEDFIDERVTVGSWSGLPSPPTDLPTREPGLVMAPPDGSTASADVTYDLLPIELVRDAIDDFVGPQLSFEFVIPGFLEDRFAGHITSVEIPWEQNRFADPLDDVTDPVHRRRIEGQAPSSLRNRVVGRVRQLRSGSAGALDRVTDEARDALTDVIAVSLFSVPVEVVARLSSEEPVASVTREGLFGFLHVDPGDHLLVVNGPGFAPLAERFVHDGGLLRAGADGELTVVAIEDAAWIRGDGRATTGVQHVRVIEDYAGVVYDGRPVEADRFAVAVHRAGRYTVEIIDDAGRPGAYRVGPNDFGDENETVREGIETGKSALAGVLLERLVELRDLAEILADRDQAAGDVGERLSLAIEHAQAAASSAQRGDGQTANEQLSSAIVVLEEALAILLSERQGGFTDASVAALEPRIGEAIRRASTAMETDL